MTGLLFGGARTIELDGDIVQVTERSRTSTISLADVVAVPAVRRTLLGATLSIATGSEKSIILRGANRRDALAFSNHVEKAWVQYNISALEREADRFSSLRAAVTALARPTRYPAACAIQVILDEARSFDDAVLSKLRMEAIGSEAASLVAEVRTFVAEPRRIRNTAIETFVIAELERWKDFFDTIGSKPLTHEQRLSVVVDEDATLVLAGAGSGKTSVITAKAAYLAKAGIRSPEEILLLAFAKNAAEEMSERVQARSGVALAARTFHALAYDIIGLVEGSKPALARHAADDALFIDTIKQILKDLVRSDPDVAKAIIKWFAQFFVEPKTEWEFKTKHDFYTHIEKLDLRTLQGEKVKSYEELQIANWLYENGIEYEYEPVYEHKVASAGRRDYCPDFRLVESGIYIEHFGVRRQTMPDGSERLTTAPFVDREQYLAGIDWKRETHSAYETTLIETYSYERQEGRLLSSLADKLAPHVTAKPRPPAEIFDRVVEMKQVDNFSQLLGTFLRKYKGGAYSVADCEAKAKKLNLGHRATAFISVFVPVFEDYERRLEDRIDFEDMILRAARYAETGRFQSPFRHILIDEFQDISQSRGKLVKALKAQHQDARVFAVGDDWQSIFRFAGSDIHLMRHFGDEFGGSFDGESGLHRTVDLGRTFRSVDQIAFAARAFVLKNPAQIEKQIVPAGKATEPAIKFVEVTANDGEKKLAEVLASILETSATSEQTSVLLLGRYRFLEPDLSDLQKRFPLLRLSFKTIHASKGLEADHVVLLKADSGRTGFPSETVDDPLLSLVSPEIEPFENAEERRVMYVAMTRARRTLTILASKSRPSSFVTELRKDLAAEREKSGTATHAVHECGECGGRLVDVMGQDGRLWYRCEHVQHCGNILPSCPSCGANLPRSSSFGSSELSCSCGAASPKCPDCKDGWFVERSGRYGSFLSCVRYPSCRGKARKYSQKVLEN
ncbi:UvrD-helicase domain-containing protein [Rhizobium phaseoli]|uniref:UvrD-helicase domain-containing protein n=1 Tax=Rhizobium phaseoli TaxID=396 RepID=UPI0007EAD791|nr:UvrD-helicase domain-containing protein [Rhizobium phaseoli]ANL33938.1 DNA helicase UvrD-like protein [Rhizobium phaseoli]ANL97663.1 DNA helicase UvrD-like protein [Rhizobium phaseoli]